MSHNSVVFITIPGNAKRAFANMLHEVSGGVELVIVQKQTKKTIFLRLIEYFRKTSIISVLRQIWFTFLLRVSSQKRNTLNFFRVTSYDNYTQAYIPEVLEVESVNSDLVYQKLQKISPDLIVVWGSGLLDTRIISTAKKVINLHLGLCPFYRGAIANQYAFFNNDISKIGATIHFVNARADAGNIIKTIPFVPGESLQDSFKKLNDTAIDEYLQVVRLILNKEEVASTPQNITEGKNGTLRKWTPEMRFKTAQKVLLWKK